MEIKQITTKETWPLRHKVMWPEKPLEYVMLPEDKNGLHYGVSSKEKIVAIVSLFINNHEAQFRKLATDLSHQNKGFASSLIQHIFKVCAANRIKRVWCNARLDKSSFYKKFGMTMTNQTFEKGGIDYVIMEYISGS